MRIAIVYSLPTKRARTTHYLETDEDTKVSALKVRDALMAKGQDVVLVPVSEDTIIQLESIQVECIVNLIEWSGLDLPLNFQAVSLMEKTGIPFTGADLANLQMTSDKLSMKAVLDTAHLPTSRWQKFETGNEPIRRDFSYPVIAKLALEHCSIGLSNDAVVPDEASLRHLVVSRIKEFNQPVIAEEFITGREFQVTVLNRPNGLAVLPPAEIFFTAASGFLTYSGRWEETHPDYHTSSIGVAKLTPPLAKKIETVARDTFTRLHFCDYARLDIRVRDEDIFILEANSNPGLDDDPEYGITVSYKALGMTFANFIWEIILSCLARFKRQLA